MIDHCSTCLPANWMPGVKLPPGATMLRTRIPSTMPNTGPPISGSSRPRPSATKAMATDSRRPGSRCESEGVAAAAVVVAFMAFSCNGAIVRLMIYQ